MRRRSLKSISHLLLQPQLFVDFGDAERGLFYHRALWLRRARSGVSLIIRRPPVRRLRGIALNCSGRRRARRGRGGRARGGRGHTNCKRGVARDTRGRGGRGAREREGKDRGHQQVGDMQSTRSEQDVRQACALRSLEGREGTCPPSRRCISRTPIPHQPPAATEHANTVRKAGPVQKRTLLSLWLLPFFLL